MAILSTSDKIAILYLESSTEFAEITKITLSSFRSWCSNIRKAGKIRGLPPSLA